MNRVDTQRVCHAHAVPAHVRSRLRTAIRRANILDEVNEAGRCYRKDGIAMRHRMQMPCDEAVIRQALHAPPERAPAQLVPVVPHELPQLRLGYVFAVHDLTQQRQILCRAERDYSFEITHTGLTSLRAITLQYLADPAAGLRRMFLAYHEPIQMAARRSELPVARCLR